ncbi:hypothetical protein CKO44_07630 [Rubrivivax gelatinosus]|uniref:TraR/DksA C4-type zinc finger protein n=1 Tax=Rubrivivax gelatinosus TaxID=28068 RepID=UPI001902ECAC|nr:hypothetical protein [Rubrivivax gelatinosus]MBZ8142922.1 hypothetical protein [Rubrivivax gelatinosus]
MTNSAPLSWLEPAPSSDEVEAEAHLQVRCNRQPYCDGCGDPIPPSVSRAKPDATLCLACQALFDSKEGTS